MHSVGCSVEYNKVLRLETQLANAVLRQMEDNDGLYIQHDLVKGRFIFCAADNLDFLEDTPDGKGTLHATVMSCYQQCCEGDSSQVLDLSDPATDRSLKTMPSCMNFVSSYCGPKSIKSVQLIQAPEGCETLHSYVSLTASYALLDLAWLLCKCDSIFCSLVDVGHAGIRCTRI